MNFFKNVGNSEGGPPSIYKLLHVSLYILEAVIQKNSQTKILVFLQGSHPGIYNVNIYILIAIVPQNN